MNHKNNLDFQNPQITTILTTYRRPPLLKKAIESVLSQTYPHFTLIVLDNASGDETESTVREIIKTDSRVQFHRHSENIGMMANYSYGYSLIKTKYFTFLSDDDILSPCFFETALQGFEKNECLGFSACDVIINDENNAIKGPISKWSREGIFESPEGLFEMIEHEFKFPVPLCVMFNMDVVKEIPPEFSKEVQLLWDPNFLMQIAAQHPFAVNKKTCGTYFVHNQAFSSSFYSSLRTTSESLTQLIIASKRSIKNVMDNPKISNATKIKFQRIYNESKRKDLKSFIRGYLQHRHISNAFSTTMLMFINFGFDGEIIWYFFKGIMKPRNFLGLLQLAHQKSFGFLFNKNTTL